MSMLCVSFHELFELIMKTYRLESVVTKVFILSLFYFQKILIKPALFIYRYNGLSAYGQSKLANILHANELSRRLKVFLVHRYQSMWNNIF